MASYSITPVEKGIFRCQHDAPLSHEEVRALASFLHDYRGKLLIDLHKVSGDECKELIRHLRPMMPISAIFGADIQDSDIEIPESYCTDEVRCFKTEKEALTWLRNQ
jgi:hypothetical protein